MFEERKRGEERRGSNLHTNDSTTTSCRFSSPTMVHGNINNNNNNRNKCSSHERRRLITGSSSSSSSSSSSFSSSSGLKPQDADYPQPQLIEEVEALILARVPRSDYGTISLVNKRFLSLIKTGEIYNIRKQIKFKEPTVFMLASGEQRWWAFDGHHFNTLRQLPILPAEFPFHNGDKETLCAGTHLLVSGNEHEAGPTVWIYNLVTNQWFRGPPMINSRNMFAAATCGTFGYVAGGVVKTGIGYESEKKYTSSAERYNPESKSWEALPNMHRKRGSCSGFYMDDRFFVIGGENMEGNLTCAEAFDEKRRKWDLIPNMLADMPVLNPRSPPLVAVANNELYSLEPSTNQLMVYVKKTQSWKRLGPVPVRADAMGGWGVAFKSLGVELLVIGGNANAFAGPMLIYTCCPDPNARELNWRRVEVPRNRLQPFIFNCSVMLV